VFTAISWLLVAAGLTCVALDMFLHDLGRLMRREPFTMLLWGEFDARHPFYVFAVLDFFAPYALLFLGLFAAASFATLNMLGWMD
jgi:hypothetical protein